MSENTKPSHDDVARFLKSHPEFFVERDDLLLDLTIPHESGDAISLVQRQVNILRERNIELRQRLNQLLDVAKENDNLFEKTRQLTLRLMEASSLDQLFLTLENTLKEQFGSESISLLLYDNQFLLSGKQPYVRSVTSTDAQQALGNLARSGKALCGILREDEIQWLFREDAPQVASMAMVPLNYQGELGILAIGSSDAQHFRSSLGTLFVSHIGDVLARMLGRYRGSRSQASTA